VVMLLAVLFVLSADAQTAPSKGKNPVIVIPGIMGSKLVNKKTKETVWVRLIESDVDDLSLPVSPNLEANVDDLVPDGILDKVRIFKFLPGISIYAELLEYLEKKSGYVRGDWENPVFEDGLDMYFEFGYDWRRDNVENAHLLLEKIKKLKTKLKKPDLKFDVIGHSMGGLIARYAAMYGTEDLRENQKPNWSGVRHFEKIFLMGTPNEGSMGALDSLIFGVSVDAIAGRYFPKYLSREVVFTIPTLFQLLPHGKSLKIYDDLMQPIKLDIYDPDTWEKYGWSPAFDEKYLGPLDKEKRKNVRCISAPFCGGQGSFTKLSLRKLLFPNQSAFMSTEVTARTHFRERSFILIRKRKAGRLCCGVTASKTHSEKRSLKRSSSNIFSKRETEQFQGLHCLRKTSKTLTAKVFFGKKEFSQNSLFFVNRTPHFPETRSSTPVSAPI
jgi:hypothetical protein